MCVLSLCWDRSGECLQDASQELGSPEIPEPRVYLREKGLEDSQGSSRTPWAALVFITGTSRPSSGTQQQGASLWREMRIIFKEMDLEVISPSCKLSQEFTENGHLPLKVTAPVLHWA